MKPVEIEFLMKDNMTSGINRSQKSVEQLTTKIAKQKEVVKQITDDVKELEKAYKKAAPGNAQKAALQELNAAKKVLEEEKAILSGLEQQNVSMRAQLRMLTNEITNTTLEYRRMTDAEKNSAAGQEMKHKLEELIKKAGDLRDAMDDVNRQVRGEASDTKNFDGIAQGLNVVVSTAGAATGAFQLFGASQEELINIQTKLQATLAISNALSVVQNNLQRESALMIGIRTIQEKAHTTAIAIRTAAEGKGIVVTKLATLAQAAFNAVANANPYVLLATAILTVVGALVAFTAGSKKATEAEKQQREEGERLKKQQEEMSTALGKAAGNVEAKYRSLQQQWQRLKTESEKNKWIKDNANKFHELGLNVNSVADAEQVLVDMAPQVIAALKAVAEAEAYSDLYKQSIKDRAEKWERRVKSTSTGDFYKVESGGRWVSSTTGIPKEWQEAGLGAGDYEYRFRGQVSTEAKLTQQGIDKINAYRISEAHKLNKKLQATYDEEVDFYSKKWDEAEKKALDAQSKIPSSLRYSANETDKGGNINAEKEESKRAKELSELQESNRQKEIDQMAEGAEKKRAQLRADYEKEIGELSKLEQKWRSAQKGELTKDQTEALESARKLAKSKLDAGEEEVAKEEAELAKAQRRTEIQAMVEYLKEYGSYQQQKLAIAEEYAQKIAEVETSEADEATKQWQKKKLDKERLQKEANITFESISRGIDWYSLFSGVGNLTKEMLAPMMEQLQAWVKTDEYRDADAETKQKVADLIQEMRNYIGTDQSVTWRSLDNAIKDFSAAVSAYDSAKAKEDIAVKAREEGKKKLASGDITTDEYKELERKALELGNATAQARKDMEAFASTLNNTSEEVANFTSSLTTALINAKGWTDAEGFSEVQSAVGNIDQLKGALDSILPTLGDGMAKNIGMSLSGTIGSGLSSIGGGLSSILSSGLGSVIGIIAQIPKLILDLASTIKNFVTGILNTLTELISLRWIDDLVVSILDAVGNLIDAIFDLPENLYHVLEAIVVNGVGGLLDSVLGRIGNILSFGALSSGGPSEWFTNSNAAEVAETIERLTNRNELLEQAIEDLTDEMKSARGVAAIDTSRRARQLQEETNANYLGIAKAQAGYHSAHHSFNYYWGGYNQEQINRLSQQIGRQWNGDLWSLSPEEMKILRSNVDMWEQIQNTGKGGYGGRVADKLNDYIEQAGKLQEITDALYENLTTTTKDNVFSDFLNDLYNLADGSEDVMDDIAENWQKMVNRMAVNNLVGAKFQQNLDEWYEELAKLNEARTNGEITDEEYRKRLDALKEEYDNYVESAKRDIETLRTEGIIQATEENAGVTQSGKSGAFTTMSQDQATKLEGVFVSGQMHWASIDDKLTDVTRQMDEAGSHLRQIAENTGNSASALGEIKEDIKKVIRDGIKVK